MTHEQREQVDDGGLIELPQGPHMVPPMSLRDWFAGQALIGILGSRNGFLVDTGTQNAPKWAYEVADAMLRARRGGE